MKLHTNERPNSVEPQASLQVGSGSETSSKRKSRRRPKSKKAPLIEKRQGAENEPIETEVRQGEVRVIWNREDASRDAQAKPEKVQQQKQHETAKKVAHTPVVEAVLRPEKTKLDHQKPEAPKETPKPIEQKPAVSPVVEAVPEKVEAAEPVDERTSEDFQKMLDDLVAERYADAEREARAETVATPPRPRPVEPVPMVEQMPQPPPLPPEASSYRHFFWNEPTIMSPAELQAERSMLPEVQNAQASAPATPNSDRPYVESQVTVQPSQAENFPLPTNPYIAESPTMPKPEMQPEEAFDRSETTLLGKEMVHDAPSLEAVPLHDINEPNFPERMPGAFQPANEVDFMQLEPETAMATPTGEAIMPTPAQPEGLGLAELMKLSKKIKIDGVLLHEVFKAKRIDQEGLKAVVLSFLRGGDVRKQLTDEIIAKEKSFELDPLNRRKSSGHVRVAMAHASAKAAQTSYSFGKAASSVARGTGRALMVTAAQASQELQSRGVSVHWPSVIAVGIIYTLIIILLIV